MANKNWEWTPARDCLAASINILIHEGHFTTEDVQEACDKGVESLFDLLNETYQKVVEKEEKNH